MRRGLEIYFWITMGSLKGALSMFRIRKMPLPWELASGLTMYVFLKLRTYIFISSEVLFEDSPVHGHAIGHREEIILFWESLPHFLQIISQ
jgi:hypothetical protein